MSSFTHHLEEAVLNDKLKQSLFMGLSRNDGNRRGNFAVWEDDAEGGKQIDEDGGIDEPGTGWWFDPDEGESGAWKTESASGRCAAYSRQALTSGSWHAVDVVLGIDGDSELRLSATLEWTAAGANEDWGTISHFFIADASSGGNILAWGQLPDSVQIVEGMQAKIWANTIVVRMTD